MTSSPAVCILIVVGMLFAQQAAAQPRDFLRKVSVREVEADLQATLADLLSGTSSVATKRVAAIEASTWQTFQSLPKNDVGRLAPAAVRYIVHGYFAKAHGWLIKGLEPHGNQLNSSEVHEVSVLQDKAPLLVENLLEARQADRGLNHNDVVTMIAVLEQMMFDESVTLLEAAYRLHGLSVEEEIGEDMLHTLLQSYLLLFGEGSKANLFDVERHQRLLKSRKRAEVHSGTSHQEFEHGTVLNFEYTRRHTTNPFGPRRYSFQGAVEIMEDLAQHYGKWQNSECRDMKAHLVELDPEGLGRLPLGLFYARPEGASYHFSESADYLRQIGALDETSPGNPQVYIANYVGGPSNCLASSAYYSVCCLSECDTILGDLERHVKAPTASPETLLSFAVDHQDGAVLSDGLKEKLRAIAARHGGEVPLHGRLFAQWLHFAFPHECPYPTVLESATPTVLESAYATSMASVEERKQHLESFAVAAPTAEDFDIDGRWTDHEVLPLHSQPRSSLFGGFMRSVVMVVALCVALRSVWAAWQATGASLKNPLKTTMKSKKDDDFLPTSFRNGMYV